MLSIGVIHQVAFKNKEAPTLGTRPSTEPGRKLITLRGGAPASEERRDGQPRHRQTLLHPANAFTEPKNLLPGVQSLDAIMLVLLAGIFVCHIATVVMLFVSTIANVWMRNNNDASAGIWKACAAGTCVLLPNLGENESAMKAVQAFMILAIIFGCIALMAFIAQLFTLDKGCRFYITGSIMLFCWLCIMIAASIYTARFPSTYGSDWYHGYCFILAWICFCLSFLAGLFYLVLRKK